MHTLDLVYIFFITVPLTVVVGGLCYTIGRNVGRLWLDHRVKLALLEKLESKPHLLRSFDELQDLLDDTPKHEAESSKTDYLITGVLLGAIGIGCVVIAQTTSGRAAVGVYFGGVASVALGFILVLLGLLTRFLERSPARSDGRPRIPWLLRWFRKG